MTPENDVNKESDRDDIDNKEEVENASAFTAGKDANKDAKKDAQPDEKVGVESASSGVNNGVEKEDDSDSEPVTAADADSDDTSAETESDAPDEQEDDIDRAARAQAQSALSDADSDDPLGFGNQRMDGDSVDGEDNPLQSQLEQAEAKVASQADQLIRMQAEMENQRKRAQNDVTKAHKFALEKIALDLLPVRDSLEMGLQAATAEDADPAKIVEGSELTLKMLTQALEKYNIVEVNPIDEKFDPEFHQAMSMQPVEGKEPNTVAGVMQKGYTLNDRLIRPALVMVAK